jgi:general L-amino acid transport system substrate-binding protein
MALGMIPLVMLMPLLLVGCGDAADPTDMAGPGQKTGRLAAILARGELVCGVSGELPGFSFVDQNGDYSGLDVDICRALAAALFDDPTKVEYRNLNAKERFTALQTGEIDILSRNTTWSSSRDTATGLEFAPVVFYDSQGLMVRRNGPIKNLADLKNKAICIQIGTTTEQNLTDQMRQRNIAYKPLVFEDVNTVFGSYAEGRCDAVTADRSQLTSRRVKFPQPDQHMILDEPLSKEPLAPAVVDGDSQWADVVKWVVYGLIEAEELNINQGNLAQQAQSANPTIKRFLGNEGTIGQDIGLSNDFAVRMIRHVGNYAEIYDRNLGSKTPLNLPRGQNRLWNQGGLMYSPPFR